MLVFTAEDLKSYAAHIASTCGASVSAAEALADTLIEAELRGVCTHGLPRLPQYADRLLSGAISGTSEPEVHVTRCAVVVDGNNALGQHVARVAVDNMIPIARKNGVAVVVVRNSNHFGFAGYYATEIAKSDMVGLVTSNGTPCVSVPGGKAPFFSNNPLALSAKLNPTAYVEMDLALSVTSRANIRKAQEDHYDIPVGWANGPDGSPTQSPELALQGAMLPMGGNRGFGLLFALEILSGLLSNGSVADEVASKDVGRYPEGTCHFFLALNVQDFLPRTAFASKLANLIARMRNVPQRVGEPLPRYPGERRWVRRNRCLRDGVPLDLNLVRRLQSLSDARGVPFPQPKESVYDEKA